MYGYLIKSEIAKIFFCIIFDLVKEKGLYLPVLKQEISVTKGNLLMSVKSSDGYMMSDDSFEWLTI